MTAASPPRVRVFAPATIGNVGPGLDILGCAVTGPGDRVVAERSSAAGITIRETGHPELPSDPNRHTAGIAAREVLKRARSQSVGISLSVHKGLPLSAGQGGSAASAVAAAVATNALLGNPVDEHGLLEACLLAEEAVAGRHADNVAPALLGGVVLVRSLDPLEVVRLPLAGDLLIVLAHPDQRVRTAESRSVLPAQLPRSVALHQAAQVAALVTALATGDCELLGRSLDDRIAEPARAPLLPGFREAKAAAMSAGALGGSISGSGPTAFAMAPDEATADRVARAMAGAYQALDVQCTVRVARIDTRGARMEPEPHSVGAGDSS